MKIAILMSTYNGDKYIEEQIESIINQEGAFQIDLWVRDDGSTDSTCDILKRYSSEGKLEWYSEKNLGPAKSFLELLKKCNGIYDYYAFSDQDDFWAKDKLKKAIESIKDIGSPCLYVANAEIVDSELSGVGRNVYKLPPKTDFKTLICAGGLLGCTMVFNAQLSDKICTNDKMEKIVMHDFYVAAICASIGGKIVYDTRTCMKYRQHGSNVIGVSCGLIETLKNRFKAIVSPAKMSIAEQAEEISMQYSNEIQEDNMKWLKRVADYRRNVFTRVGLACSNQVSYMNKNIGLKNRLSILLGNR